MSRNSKIFLTTQASLFQELKLMAESGSTLKGTQRADSSVLAGFSLLELLALTLMSYYYPYL